MNGNCIDTCIDRAFDYLPEFFLGLIRFIIARPYFYHHWAGNFTPHHFYNLDCLFGLIQQCSSPPSSQHLRRRTCKIQVDNIISDPLKFLRSLCHFFRLTAENLRADGMFIVTGAKCLFGQNLRIRCALCQHHSCKSKRTFEPTGDCPHRVITVAAQRRLKKGDIQ